MQVYGLSFYKDINSLSQTESYTDRLKELNMELVSDTGSLEWDSTKGILYGTNIKLNYTGNETGWIKLKDNTNQYWQYVKLNKTISIPQYVQAIIKDIDWNNPTITIKHPFLRKYTTISVFCPGGTVVSQNHSDYVFRFTLKSKLINKAKQVLITFVCDCLLLEKACFACHGGDFFKWEDNSSWFIGNNDNANSTKQIIGSALFKSENDTLIKDINLLDTTNFYRLNNQSTKSYSCKNNEELFYNWTKSEEDITQIPSFACLHAMIYNRVKILKEDNGLIYLVEGDLSGYTGYIYAPPANSVAYVFYRDPNCKIEVENKIDIKYEHVLFDEYNNNLSGYFGANMLSEKLNGTIEEYCNFFPYAKFYSRQNEIINPYIYDNALSFLSNQTIYNLPNVSSHYNYYGTAIIGDFTTTKYMWSGNFHEGTTTGWTDPQPYVLSIKVSGVEMKYKEINSTSGWKSASLTKFPFIQIETQEIQKPIASSKSYVRKTIDRGDNKYNYAGFRMNISEEPVSKTPSNYVTVNDGKYVYKDFDSYYNKTRLFRRIPMKCNITIDYPHCFQKTQTPTVSAIELEADSGSINDTDMWASFKLHIKTDELLQSADKAVFTKAEDIPRYAEGVEVWSYSNVWKADNGIEHNYRSTSYDNYTKQHYSNYISAYCDMTTTDNNSIKNSWLVIETLV